MNTTWRKPKMSPSQAIGTPEEPAPVEPAVEVRHRLQEQSRDLDQQQETASRGMWVFLATELMLFGSLFLGLGAYQYSYGKAFEEASKHLNWPIGGINMLVLVSSSLWMALAVHQAQLGNQKLMVLFLWLTALLGSAFLVLKWIEYYPVFQVNLVPGLNFDSIDV